MSLSLWTFHISTSSFTAVFCNTPTCVAQVAFLRKGIAVDKNNTEASIETKILIVSDFVPMYYDSIFPRRQTTDALPCGTGEVMSHAQ